MREQVLDYLCRHRLLKPGERVGVAVSGGADSVGLLRLLLELRAELGIVVSVAHFHHQIRGAEANADAQFVAALAESHNLELHSGSGDAPAHAKANHVSLETAARELRYGFFIELLKSCAVDTVATGHTLDDQAETVLMRLVRGAGGRGLAGIHPRLRHPGPIVRPLLRVRRRELEEYLRGLGQEWREDSSNRDRKHLRNRVRHELVPLLERDFNPEVARVLAETAEVARAEEEFWQHEIERLLPDVCPEGEASLKLKPLVAQPLAVQRRLVRAALECAGAAFDFRHGEEILRLAQKSRGAVELPGGWRVRREKGGLRIEKQAGGAGARVSPARAGRDAAGRGAQRDPADGGCGRKGGVKV
ncbi:MAG: tRNA lysidine(34) synthetase TilS [Terriglobales bacterium]